MITAARILIISLVCILFVGPAHAAQQMGNGICETTSTSGTGTVSLAGTYAPYSTFVSQIASGNTVTYRITTGTSPTQKVETGTGTFTDGAPDTLSRNAEWTTDDQTAPIDELSISGTSTVCLGTAASTFDGDKGDITFSAGFSVAAIDADSVALTTDTTGNYAAGDGEAGAALTGDSATSFFSTGTIESARLPSASTTASGIAELIVSSEYLVGTDTTRTLVTDQVWGAAAFVGLSDASTITVDMSTFLNASVTIDGNRTLGNPTNEKVGQTGVIAVSASTSTRTLALDTQYTRVGAASSAAIEIETDETVYLTYFVRATDNILITGVMSSDPDASGWVKLASGTFSAASAVDFAIPTNTQWRVIKLYYNLDLSADADFGFRTDSDAGASVDAGGSDYTYSVNEIVAGVSSPDFSNADPNLWLGTFEGSTASRQTGIEVTLYDPGAAAYTNIESNSVGVDTAGGSVGMSGWGQRASATDVDYVRLFPSTGTVTGSYVIMGLR